MDRIYRMQNQLIHYSPLTTHYSRLRSTVIPHPSSFILRLVGRLARLLRRRLDACGRSADGAELLAGAQPRQRGGLALLHGQADVDNFLDFVARADVEAAAVGE